MKFFFRHKLDKGISNYALNQFLTLRSYSKDFDFFIRNEGFSSIVEFSFEFESLYMKMSFFFVKSDTVLKEPVFNYLVQLSVALDRMHSLD